jgi:hypothetical protein
MRLALVSPIAESSQEAMLLANRGFTLRVVQGGAADVLLPQPRGGSLAFLLPNTMTASHLPERALQASRAARRCTILVQRSAGDLHAVEALQSSWYAPVPARVTITSVVDWFACDHHGAALQV